MPFERRHDLLGLTAPESRQDWNVEVGRPAWIGTGEDERDVRAQERLERPPDLLRRAVVGELEEPAVELGICLRHATAVTDSRCRLHRLAVSGELVHVGLGHARYGRARTERLERRADGVGLEDLPARGAAQPGAF